MTIPKFSATVPVVDGTASAGVGLSGSRSDHVHPGLPNLIQQVLLVYDTGNINVANGGQGLGILQGIVTPTDGQLICLAAQTAPHEQGVWAAHSTAWTRAPGWGIGDVIPVGTYIHSVNSVYSNRYRMTNATAPTINTDTVVFAFDEVLANMAARTWKGNASNGVGAPGDNTVAVGGIVGCAIGGTTITSLTGPQTLGIVEGTANVVALTDAATVATDASLGSVFTLLFTSAVGNTRIMGAPTNPVNGRRIRYRFKQDATGSRVVTWNAAFHHPGGTAPTFPTAANTIVYIDFIYNGTDAVWERTDYTKNIGGATNLDSLYGVAPVARATAITTPTAPGATYLQAEAAAMKTAVDAIRVALANVGITL